MTTARVKHRDYIPWGWVAIEFCNVEFFGSSADEFQSKWNKIEYKKWRKITPQIENLDKSIFDTKNDIAKINNSLQLEKRWWRIFKTQKEKELIKKREGLIDYIGQLESRRKELESNMFYSASELHYLAENFLKENSFVLQSSNSAGNECITYTDIWVRND